MQDHDLLNLVLTGDTEGVLRGWEFAGRKEYGDDEFAEYAEERRKVEGGDVLEGFGEISRRGGGWGWEEIRIGVLEGLGLGGGNLYIFRS